MEEERMRPDDRIKSQMVNVVRKMRRMSMSGLLNGIAHGEYYALDKIRKFEEEHPDSPGIWVSDLAKDMHIASSAASRMLSGLEGKELVARKMDPKNRRNTCVCLTEKGLQTLADSSRKMDEFQERIIMRMGNERINQLVELWTSLSDVMEEELAAMEEELEPQGGGQMGQGGRQAGGKQEA